MRSFTITAGDGGVRLNRYLLRVAPALPASLMYKYLREKKIKLNKKRCEASTRLAEGDLLELYIPDSFFEETRRMPDFMRASKELDIAYEDGNFAALNKPAGVLVHADGAEYSDTLLARFSRRLYERGEYDPNAEAAFAPAACNRLDRGTEGLVLAAKTSSAARELDGMIKRRLIDKRYLAVCSGVPPTDGSYGAYLIKNERSNTVRVSERESEGARDITTEFRTLATANGLALIEARLITGRPHQIRAHLRYLGAPVLGDKKYGDAALNEQLGENTQLLCAYKLTFELDEEAKQAPLGYLDGKTIELREVGFVGRYFKGAKG